MKLKTFILPLLCLAFGLRANAQANGPVQTFTWDKPYAVERIKAPRNRQVRNVILMIGDGMSLMHIEAAWTVNRGHLWLENAQATGISKTPASNRLITDSGSGGTSLATGYKTRYHAVGVDPDGKPLKSLVDYAKGKGLSAGVAVTCRLWDATPMDFLSHNIDRDNEQELLAGMVKSPVDYVFGGGAKYFLHRDDGRNLFDELQQKGYHISRTFDDLLIYGDGNEKITYTVDETTVPDKYEKSVSGDAERGFVITNTRKADPPASAEPSENGGSGVNTGDTGTIAGWLLLMACSLLTALTAAREKHRK